MSSNIKHPQKIYMDEAIAEARKAVEEGQYALGAIAINEAGDILAIAHTTLHKDNDPTAHAEINVIRQAAQKLNSRYLEGVWLYTTQEPCPMCTSAAIWARMRGIIFGAMKDDALEIFHQQGNSKFTWRQIDIPAEYIVAKGNPKLELIGGFQREECLKLYSF